MSREVIRSREADRDLEEIAAGLEELSEDLAGRFLDEVARGLRQLARMPGLGEKVETRAPGLDGLRCSRVPTFPNHLVFYLHDEAAIRVVRVLHGARDIEALLGGGD